MRSLNLWLNLQLNSRHGILKFSGTVCLVKFKIPQTRIGAVLNGTATHCVKFYYFTRTAPDFEMASAGRNFKIPPRVGI